MSSEGVIRLPSARLLALPIDISQPRSSAAYVITREACERMVKIAMPIRVLADAWWHFYGKVLSTGCAVSRGYYKFVKFPNFPLPSASIRWAVASVPHPWSSH